MKKEEIKKLEDDLWKAADNLRANSDLKSSEYSTTVLGIIFLKYADNKYRQNEQAILEEYAQLKGTSREKPVSEIAIEKCGFYLPDHARYEYLLKLPEEKNIAKSIKQAMTAIEEYKPELEGVLPKDAYASLTRTDKTIPNQLLKTFADIPQDASGDVFGQIYEYFLGEFAKSEGQRGGEFFTSRSVVRLMVEIIEPHQGKVFDPACGSGGMFVQSAHFIEQHRHELTNGNGNIFVCGQDKILETVKLAKMNLAVNGLRGEIKQANTYYEDPYESFNQFDYVLANPPFNIDDVALKRVESDKRFNTYGIPRTKTKNKKTENEKESVPNGNYLWINLFATSLKPQGRAALVMANSASDARHSEAEIRRTLIEQNLIYGMLTLPSNMFYTVKLPATLWFFDKAKNDDRILFIDARNIFTQIDRARREFSDEQIQNIAVISRLHKGRREDFIRLIESYFAQGMGKLTENKVQVELLSRQLLEVIDDKSAKQAVTKLVKHWAVLPRLQKTHASYLDKHATEKSLDKKNKAQHSLREAFDPFYATLHEELKALDTIVRDHEKHQMERAQVEGRRVMTDRKTKALKTTLDALHEGVNKAQSYFSHIQWLQECFPQAVYEDITGLCKLATPEEVKEQDYSLNPGRYVGVAIEEDGKTEKEFITDLLAMNEEFTKLNQESRRLERVILGNTRKLTGEA